MYILFRLSGSGKQERMVQGGNSTEREYFAVAELRALESPSSDSKPDPTTA